MTASNSYTCNFKLLNTVNLFCEPNGFIKWIVEDGKTSINIANTTIIYENNTILAIVDFKPLGNSYQTVCELLVELSENDFKTNKCIFS